MTLDELQQAVEHLEKLAMKLLQTQRREEAEELRGACVSYRDEMGYYGGGDTSFSGIGEQITKLRATAALYLTAPINRLQATSELSTAIFRLKSAFQALRPPADKG